MILLDGKRIANSIYGDLAKRTQDYVAKGKRPPCLAIVLVGTDLASEIYVRAKMKIAEHIRYRVQLIRFPEQTAYETVAKEMAQLAADPQVDAMIVQLPLPVHLRPYKNQLIQLIPVSKDVDGFHFNNIGNVYSDAPATIAATPYGILLLLQAYSISVAGKHITIVGRSHIVGRPLALLLASKNSLGNATVTLCHTHTQNIAQHTRAADMVVVAMGSPNFLRKDMVKEGAIVIDVGINRVEDKTRGRGYRIVGDACTEELKEKVAYISPVPGGVGPMTIAALMKNTMAIYEQSMIL